MVGRLGTVRLAYADTRADLGTVLAIVPLASCNVAVVGAWLELRLDSSALTRHRALVAYAQPLHASSCSAASSCCGAMSAGAFP